MKKKIPKVLCDWIYHTVAHLVGGYYATATLVLQISSEISTFTVSIRKLNGLSKGTKISESMKNWNDDV